MQTLIIHDMEGHIYSILSGEFKTPVGMPYIITEVPEGKYIEGVNAQTSEVILGDLPRKEIDIINEKIDAAIVELSMIIAMGGMPNV